MRKLGWLTLWVGVAVVAAGCSGSSGTKDPGGQPDVVAPDNGADPGVDLGTDPGVDLGTDPGEDPGSPADTPATLDVPVSPDTGNDPGPADIGEEEEASVIPDVPLADLPFDTLPALPPGKTFTTRYAAGTARKLVNPDQSVHLGGFGFCAGDENLCRSSGGIHDDVSASAVAIADTVDKRVIVFVGVDSSGIVRADMDTMHHMIQNELGKEGIGFPGEQLIISASHAHSAPDAVGLWGPLYGAGRQEWYSDMLRAQVVAAAKEAVLNLADVELTWGTGTYQNSSEDGLTEDADMFVLRGNKPAGGATVFTLTRWPGHPTTYGSNNLGVSADWPGTFRKRLEEKVGGLAVFMQGPIGSVYPYRPGECGEAQEAFPNGYHTPYKDKDHPGITAADCMKVTCTGYAIAAAAEEALKNAKPVAETGIRFQHGTFTFHPTNGSLMLLAQIGPLPFQYVDIEDPNAQMDSVISWATLGDLNWLSTPGESFPSFAAEAKKILTDAGFTNPIVMGLAQDWMGYLLLESQWKDENLSYHMSLSAGSEVEPKFMAKLREMVAAAKAR